MQPNSFAFATRLIEDCSPHEARVALYRGGTASFWKRQELSAFWNATLFLLDFEGFHHRNTEIVTQYYFQSLLQVILKGRFSSGLEGASAIKYILVI